MREAYQVNKTIIITPAEKLKAYHTSYTFTHMKAVNPHLTDKGSSPSPGASF
jgi:hypothetical protein